MKDKIKKVFEAYEKAFDQLDIEKQASMFAEHFISAGPKGSIAGNRNEFIKMSHKTAAFYRNVGQTGAKILSMKETAISNEYIMVTVHWGVTFKKTGDKRVEFNVSYFIQNTDDDPKIIMFISHEDEDETMKKLALTN